MCDVNSRNIASIIHMSNKEIKIQFIKHNFQNRMFIIFGNFTLILKWIGNIIF